MNCILIQSIIAVYGCTVFLGLRKKRQTLYLPICQAGHGFGKEMQVLINVHQCINVNAAKQSVGVYQN